MPNHVTHRVAFKSVDKADMDAFIERFFTADETGKLELDFNKIVPMPEILKDSESSSSVANGLAVLGRSDIPAGFGSTKSLGEMLSYAWVQGKGITTEELLKREPDCIAKAEAAIKAYEECGHTSWYSWSVENWGTKWNAYDCEVERTEDRELWVKFDTAWSPPSPVLEALHDLAPEISFAGACFDEGWNFACSFTGEAGFFQIENREVNAEVYELVYGEAPPVDDEEYEEETALLEDHTNG